MATNEIPEELRWIRELTKARLQTLFVESYNQHKADVQAIALIYPITKQRDALQVQVEAGEGLAEALDWFVHIYNGASKGGDEYSPPVPAEWADCEGQSIVALTAWREATGE